MSSNRIIEFAHMYLHKMLYDIYFLRYNSANKDNHISENRVNRFRSLITGSKDEYCDVG